MNHWEERALDVLDVLDVLEGNVVACLLSILSVHATRFGVTRTHHFKSKSLSLALPWAKKNVAEDTFQLTFHRSHLVFSTKRHAKISRRQNISFLFGTSHFLTVQILKVVILLLGRILPYSTSLC